MQRRSVWALALVVVWASSCGSTTKPPGSDVDISGPDGPLGDGGAGERGADAPIGAVPAEECARRQCNASVPDLCCPMACSGITDIDCAGCGNGRLEPGEVCDPPERCATSCPQLKCEKQRLKSAGTCAAVCVSGGTQTSCVDGDECCPDGCTAANDRDCTSKCNNGTLEPGELCDPLASCAQGCPMQGCTILTLASPGTCLAHCVPMGQETQCRNDDGCCPAGCTAANDDDCAVQCGNGTIEGKETCDPLSSCPTECPAQGCRLQRLLNAGTCTAVCVEEGLQTECRPNRDGCCPPGCNSSNDGDCPVLCGNGVVEMGETCDPVSSCLDRERACVSDGTTMRTRMGDPGKCQFTCVEAARACGPSDRFCPPGCGPTMDPDCLGCGNGVVEAGETCDPPAACRTLQMMCTSDQSTIRTPTGDANACTFACREMARPCGPADGACPTGCSPTRDPDCVGCGNGMLDPGETCDPVIVCQERSNSCVSDRNTVRTRTGDPLACRFVCTETPRMCGPADMECPSNCGPTMDRDCPGCGNLKVEAGETCDPCNPADVTACVGDENTIRMPMGSAAMCTFACTMSPRPCLSGDGFCPTMCTRANDGDCLAAPGDPCKMTSECGMGTCTDSHCCVAQCGVCQSCTAAGGTCENITKGLQDNVPAGTCTGASLCDGAGHCQAPPCQLVLNPTGIDFGPVCMGQSGSRSITVSNPCNMALPPPSVSTNNGEFRLQSNTCANGIPAGGNCTLGLLFTPRGEGARGGTLTVSSTGGGTATADLKGIGQASGLAFKPDTVPYPNTPPGQTTFQSVTVNNIGKVDSGALRLTVSPVDAPFAVAANTCTKALAPGDSCTLRIGFTPRAPGTYNATISAASPTTCPAAASLSGTSSGIIVGGPGPVAQ